VADAVCGTQFAGKWSVCADRCRLLEFDDLEEAFHVARNAAIILRQARSSLNFWAA
jgi:hypothetical protein